MIMCTRLGCKRIATLAFLPVLLPAKKNPNDPGLDKIETPKERTKFDRVLEIYKLDEFGSPSKEVISSLHTSVCAALLGGIFAGIKETQMKFQDFVTRMNSEMFVSQAEAKNVLTQKMAVSFVKSFSHWGLRMGFFTALFTLNVNTLVAYHQGPSVWHFIVSGVVTGSIYRIPMGLRAMIAAGTVGGCLGLCAGCVSVGMLSISGFSYDEIEAWHYNVRNMREQKYQETLDRIEKVHVPDNPLIVDREKIIKAAAVEASIQSESTPLTK